jgi:hypothetical protein
MYFFLQQSNYRGFIASINNARRLFGRLKLTTAIYLEHYMPVQQTELPYCTSISSK